MVSPPPPPFAPAAALVAPLDQSALLVLPASKRAREHGYQHGHGGLQSEQPAPDECARHIDEPLSSRQGSLRLRFDAVCTGRHLPPLPDSSLKHQVVHVWSWQHYCGVTHARM